MSKIPATHCRHGHPWNDENTRFNNRGDRYCIICQRVQGAAYRRRKGRKPRIFSMTIPIYCRHGHLWSENIRYDSRGYRVVAACKRASDKKRLSEPPSGSPKKPFCPHGHPMIAGNIKWASGWICVACKRACDRRTEKPVTREKLERIFAALHEGKALAECYGKKNNRYVGGKIVDSGALIKYLRENPRIGKRIRALSRTNRRTIMQAVADRKRIVAAPAIMRNNGADAYQAILRATANLWEGERGDVMSLMFVAAAEGRLKPKDAAARLPEFLRDHRRQFGKFGPVSLDQPLFDDGSVTLGDTITTGLWQSESSWQ